MPSPLSLDADDKSRVENEVRTERHWRPELRALVSWNADHNLGWRMRSVSGDTSGSDSLFWCRGIRTTVSSEVCGPSPATLASKTALPNVAKDGPAVPPELPVRSQRHTRLVAPGCQAKNLLRPEHTAFLARDILGRAISVAQHAVTDALDFFLDAQLG